MRKLCIGEKKKERDGELSRTQLHTEHVEVEMGKLAGKSPQPPTGRWQERSQARDALDLSPNKETQY